MAKRRNTGRLNGEELLQPRGEMLPSVQAGKKRRIRKRDKGGKHLRSSPGGFRTVPARHEKQLASHLVGYATDTHL